MTTLGQADTVRLGTVTPGVLYAGPTKVWPLEAYGAAEGMFVHVTPKEGGSDGASYVLGHAVQIINAGRITGFDYFIWSAIDYNRVISIWRNDGTLVTSVADQSGTVGWHRVMLPTPLVVAPGEVYRFGQDIMPNTSYTYNDYEPTITSTNVGWLYACYALVYGQFPSNNQPNVHRGLDLVYEKAL